MRTYKLKKYKSLIVFISICFLAIITWIFYAPYGATNYAQVSTKLQNVSQDIESLTSQNNALNEEIIKLKADNQYVEDLARKEYGLLKKNEMVFEFKK
jgi:cell division protein FtsB